MDLKGKSVELEKVNQAILYRNALGLKSRLLPRGERSNLLPRDQVKEDKKGCTLRMVIRNIQVQTHADTLGMMVHNA